MPTSKNKVNVVIVACRICGQSYRCRKEYQPTCCAGCFETMLEVSEHLFEARLLGLADQPNTYEPSALAERCISDARAFVVALSKQIRAPRLERLDSKVVAMRAAAPEAPEPKEGL